jgi:rpsU-divergently transcribed protein
VQVITAACYIGDMLPTADPIIDDQSSQDWADAAEQRVLDAALALAQTLAWSEALVLRAAQTAGLSAADAALLLPHGPADLAALLSRRHDRLALSRLAGIDASALKVRERIRVGAQARLDTALADEAAVRRATLYLARPDRAALAVSLAWETSDGLWPGCRSAARGRLPDGADRQCDGVRNVEGEASGPLRRADPGGGLAGTAAVWGAAGGLAQSVGGSRPASSQGT